MRKQIEGTFETRRAGSGAIMARVLLGDRTKSFIWEYGFGFSEEQGLDSRYLTLRIPYYHWDLDYALRCSIPEADYLRPAEINWSAIGSVSVEKAKDFAELLSWAVSHAEQLDSEFKAQYADDLAKVMEKIQMKTAIESEIVIEHEENIYSLFDIEAQEGNSELVFEFSLGIDDHILISELRYDALRRSMTEESNIKFEPEVVELFGNRLVEAYKEVRNVVVEMKRK